MNHFPLPALSSSKLTLRILLLTTLSAATGFAREIRLNELPVPTRIIQGSEYIPLLATVTALGGDVWQVDDRLIAVLPQQTGYGCELVFTPAQNRVIVNQQIITLPMPLRQLENEFYVPLAFINQLLPLKLNRMPRLLSLALSHLRDTTVLRLETDAEAYYSWIAVTSSVFRIYLQADCQLRRMEPGGLIRRLELQEHNGTELTIGTTQPCQCRITREANSVIIQFTPRPGRQIRTIVIDPGHGGRDPGAVGRTLKEKDINLDIALRLSRRLQSITRARIILTREKDEELSLASRTHKANELAADIFISIHCNAAPESPKASGFETWFLSAARTDWERAVMARENSALDFTVSDTNPARAQLVSTILRDLAQNQFLRESQALAAAIQSASSTWLRGRDRGIKQADFAVLRNAYMPAVLIECGFLTNPEEEKLLAAPDYRERIATAVAQAINDFIRRYEAGERARPESN